MTARTQSDLVAEIIKLIRPDPGCEALCRVKIGESIIQIEKTHEKREVYLPVAEDKAQLKQLHGALQKVSGLVSKLNRLPRFFLFYDGPPRPPSWFDGPRSNDPELDREIARELDQFRGVNAGEFARELAFLIERTGGLGKGLKPPKAGPRQSNARVTAAYDAYSLIAKFAPFPPTLTEGGPFFRLASMLFEAATGEHEADLTRDCRMTVSDYSLAAKGLSQFSWDPAMKAAAEELTRPASRKRRPT